MTKKKIVVLGSGPIRIGQGIEFDYCSVHCVWALREAGCEAEETQRGQYHQLQG